MAEFKYDMEEAKERTEAWWNCVNTDRALIQVFAPREKPVLQVPAPGASSIHDFWTNPEIVLPRILNKLGSTWFGGEAFPVLYPVPGRIVSITCKYLGAPNIYIDENTTWSKDIIGDWADCPPLLFDPECEWWKITETLMIRCAEMIEEKNLKCFMGLPDLNGPTEVLSGLRNPEKLCLDLLMSPGEYFKAATKVQKGWFEAWRRTFALAGRFGGSFTWMGIWSAIPAIDLQSDFSSLISADMFGEFIMPYLKEQLTFFPRTIFHLDGPGMVRHLDQLLALPELNAIQWVQGAGAGRVTEWMDLLRKIQEGGKGLYIYCEPDEVKILAKKLDPRGLMMVVKDCPSETAGRELIKAV